MIISKKLVWLIAATGLCVIGLVVVNGKRGEPDSSETAANSQPSEDDPCLRNPHACQPFDSNDQGQAAVVQQKTATTPEHSDTDDLTSSDGRKHYLYIYTATNYSGTYRAYVEKESIEAESFASKPWLRIREATILFNNDKPAPSVPGYAMATKAHYLDMAINCNEGTGIIVGSRQWTADGHLIRTDLPNKTELQASDNEPTAKIMAYVCSYRG